MSKKSEVLNIKISPGYQMTTETKFKYEKLTEEEEKKDENGDSPKSDWLLLWILGIIALLMLNIPLPPTEPYTPIPPTPDTLKPQMRPVCVTEPSWQPSNPIIEPQDVYRLPNGELVLSHPCRQSP